MHIWRCFECELCLSRHKSQKSFTHMYCVGHIHMDYVMDASHGILFNDQSITHDMQHAIYVLKRSKRWPACSALFMYCINYQSMRRSECNVSRYVCDGV